MLWNSLASASCAEFVPGEPYHMNTSWETGSPPRELEDSPQGLSTWSRSIRRQVILPFGLSPEHLSRRNFLIPSADGSGTVYGSQFIAKLLNNKRDREWELAVLSVQSEEVAEHLLIEFMERRRLEKVEIIEVDHTDPRLCYEYFREELGRSGFVPNWDFYHNNPGYNINEPPCLHVLHQRPARGLSHNSSTSVMTGRGFAHHSHVASPGRFHSCNTRSRPVSTRPHSPLAHYRHYKSQDQLHAEQVARQLQNFRLRQDDMAAESRHKALKTIKFGFFDEAEKYTNKRGAPPSAALPAQVAPETESHRPAATGCSSGIPVLDETESLSIVGETTDSPENFDSTVLGVVVTEDIGGLIPKALLSGLSGSTSTTTHLVEAPVTSHYSSVNSRNTAMKESITPFPVPHTDGSSYLGFWIDSTAPSAVTEVISNSLITSSKPPRPRSDGAPKSLLRPEKASTWATIASHNASATGYTLFSKPTNQLSRNSSRSSKLRVPNNQRGKSSMRFLGQGRQTQSRGLQRQPYHRTSGATEKGTDPAARVSVHNTTPKKDTLNLNTIRGARGFFNQGSPRTWSWADEACGAAATLTV
ncbi:hypothetical protein EX30DRAFT_348523 [Ascodesmis nigricans]|uniref:Uncharacterized protein n=1 Tax=Ascodesmis nigricans TaxID=341454 RepID=A0A4S2MY94_9PEZI|nr:hypothetical protein EX30DRAFT_348523 [Ascodesmis nigricans]